MQPLLERRLLGIPIDLVSEPSQATVGFLVRALPIDPSLSPWVGAMLAIFVLGTYSRYNDISPLEHELRSDIINIVDALPGIYLARLVERTDQPASTVRYHTRILERERELQRASVWGNLRLFPADTAPESFAYYAAIRDPASQRVLRTIEAHEPVSPGRIADLLDRAPSTISHHLARFEEEGLIQRSRDGETVSVSLAEKAIPGNRTF